MNQILPKNNLIAFAQGDLSENRNYYSKQDTSVQSQQIMTNQPPQAKQKNPMSKNQRLGVYTCVVLGILSSLALLAKTSKNHYSLNPKKMFTTPLKNTFLGKEPFEVKEVLSIGAGSCLGGLLGGALFDKKSNFQAKKREALIQYTNISLPILTVAAFSKVGKFIQNKLPKTLENGTNVQKMLYMTPKIASSLVGLGVGIIVGNKTANKINNKVFHRNDNRPVEIGDFSAHLDDICMASSYISRDNFITKSASRVIPLALTVAGTEIGCKQENSDLQKIKK